MYLCGHNTKNMHIHTKNRKPSEAYQGKEKFQSSEFYQDMKKSNDQTIQLSIHVRTQTKLLSWTKETSGLPWKQSLLHIKRSPGSALKKYNNT